MAKFIRFKDYRIDLEQIELYKHETTKLASGDKLSVHIHFKSGQTLEFVFKNDRYEIGFQFIKFLDSKLSLTMETFKTVVITNKDEYKKLSKEFNRIKSLQNRGLVDASFYDHKDQDFYAEDLQAKITALESWED